MGSPRSFRRGPACGPRGHQGSYRRHRVHFGATATATATMAKLRPEVRRRVEPSDPRRHELNRCRAIQALRELVDGAASVGFGGVARRANVDPVLALHPARTARRDRATPRPASTPHGRHSGRPRAGRLRRQLALAVGDRRARRHAAHRETRVIGRRVAGSRLRSSPSVGGVHGSTPGRGTGIGQRAHRLRPPAGKRTRNRW